MLSDLFSFASINGAPINPLFEIFRSVYLKVIPDFEILPLLFIVNSIFQSWAKIGEQRRTRAGMISWSKFSLIPVTVYLGKMKVDKCTGWRCPGANLSRGCRECLWGEAQATPCRMQMVPAGSNPPITGHSWSGWGRDTSGEMYLRRKRI